MYLHHIKAATISFILVLAVQDAHADPLGLQIGGKTGLNISKWSRSSDVPSILERTYRLGFAGGIQLRLPWREYISQQAEILLTSRGSDDKIEGRSQGVFDLYYMDLLLLARAELPIKPAILFAVAGPQVNVLLKSTSTSPDGVMNDVTGLRRFDLGVVAGAGVAFGPFSWGSLTLEARYAMGFINVDPALEDASLTNRTISLTLGYEYRRARDRAPGSKGSAR
jgi:hypothetical protein